VPSTLVEFKDWNGKPGVIPALACGRGGSESDRSVDDALGFLSFYKSLQRQEFEGPAAEALFSALGNKQFVGGLVIDDEEGRRAWEEIWTAGPLAVRYLSRACGDRTLALFPHFAAPSLYGELLDSWPMDGVQVTTYQTPADRPPAPCDAAARPAGGAS
jgi:hypothetical protein